MNKNKNVLNSIRTLLGMDSDLEMMAEAILEDGTKIATDSEEWAEGSMAFVISEDGEKMPLPTGSYATQDGATLEVVDGEVVSILKEDLSKVSKMSAEKPVKHSQTNLSNSKVSYNTGNKALDMILEMKSQN